MKYASNLIAASSCVVLLACSEAAPEVPSNSEDTGTADASGDVRDAGDASSDTPETDVSPAPAERAAACVPVPFGDSSAEVCGYYTCVDDALGCADDTYLLSFACKYADRYLAETYGEMTDDGQRFLREVFECLQETLAGEGAILDCASAEEVGFASHVPCYVDAGFCELILDDKLLVLQAIDPEDLEHPLQIAAQTEIIERCSE